MSEFDFDELDKAVNSLMGKAVSTDPDDIVKAKTLTISSTLKPDEKPEYDKLNEVAKKIGSETLLTEGERLLNSDLSTNASTAKLPAAGSIGFQPSESTEITDDAVVPVVREAPTVVKRPSNGRFMDMVRSPSPSRSVSLVPVPVSPDIPEPVAVDATVEATPASEQIMTTAVETTPVPEPAEKPRLTPFLPDTKVEKRPLGTSDLTSPIDSSNTLSDNDNAPEIPVLGPAEDVTMHPQDVVAVPTSNPTDKDNQNIIDASTIGARLSTQEQEVLTVESAEAEKEAPSAESVRAVESGDTEKLNTDSISQQYQGGVTQTNEPVGAIYDVKDYHQALGHPKKQKSGWGTVILILAIIIVCALIGAAVYFILGAGL